MGKMSEIAADVSALGEQVTFDLTGAFEREGIFKIERTAGRFLVVLMDGRAGAAATVGEALAKAQKPDAINVRKAA